MEQKTTITKPLFKIIPLWIKTAIKNAIKPYARKRFRQSLNDIPFTLPENGISVNYTGVVQQNTDDIVIGGRVKLLALEKLFPENKNSFNILYLVSSALPLFAEELVAWAKDKGVKIVWNQNGVAYPAWATAALQEEINGQLKAIIHQADYIFYQSRFCMECADKYLGKVSAPWEIAYNCIDTDLFRPTDKMPEEGPWRLISAGTHQRRYRVISLLDAMEELKKGKRKAILTIAGNLKWPGSTNAYEETLYEINKRGLAKDVVLLPEFTREQAPSIYQGQHILLHTKYNDPCPTVPLEAMACGLPVVSSKTGGMPELVTQKAGILIDLPKNWEKDISLDGIDIANAVEKIMGKWSEHSNNARALAKKKFDQIHWLERHKQVFKNLVNGYQLL